MADNDKENIEIENNADAGSSADASSPIEDASALLEDARARADEHYDLYLRTKAEMDNLQKRTERDLANAHKFALEKFAAELLPVKDSLELALQATDDNADLANHQEGVELTLKMLTSVMEKFGIHEINPLNEPFNPDFHQAMTMQEAADKPANTVMAVMQKGYSLNERLLRPAMVVVSRGGAPAGADQAAEIKAVENGENGGQVDEQA
jgi:molecular chaperone GrpE